MLIAMSTSLLANHSLKIDCVSFCNEHTTQNFTIDSKNHQSVRLEQRRF